MRRRSARWVLAITALAVAALVSASGCTRKPAPARSTRASPTGGGRRIPASSLQFEGDYLRLRVSPETMVYAQFVGSELRMATTPAGLKTATPVKGTKSDDRYVNFPSADFPLRDGQAAAGWSKIAATFFVMTRDGGKEGDTGSAPRYVGAGLLLSKQEPGALWSYNDVAEGSQAGTAPDTAPVVEIPQAEPIFLYIVCQPGREKNMGIALSLKSGKSDVSNVSRDGKPVEAALKVWDAQGRAVVEAKGPLSKFGFS